MPQPDWLTLVGLSLTLCRIGRVCNIDIFAQYLINKQLNILSVRRDLIDYCALLYVQFCYIKFGGKNALLTHFTLNVASILKTSNYLTCSVLRTSRVLLFLIII